MTPPCLMHTFFTSSGLVSRICREYFILLLRFQKVPESASAKKPKGSYKHVTKFDNRFKLISSYSEAGKYSKLFKQGISELSFLQSNEWKSILFQFPFVLGTKNILFPENDALDKDYKDVIWKLIDLVQVLEDS